MAVSLARRCGGSMNPINVTSRLTTILTEHDLAVILRDGNVCIDRAGIALQALAYQRPRVRDVETLQLDVAVRGADIQGPLIESFAGHGATVEEAVTTAFEKFCRSSLHVLLAAFIGAELGGEQVEWEEWQGRNGLWRACLGPLVIQS